MHAVYPETHQIRKKSVGIFIYRFQYPILFILFVCHLIMAWPGEMNPDSMSQYSQAINGVYDDHHPPMMALVWRYFDKIVAGSGLILLLQLTMLYLSTFMILKTAKIFIDFKSKPLWLLCIFSIPLIPQTFIYSLCIFKDIFFAFTFLSVASLLAYVTLSKTKITGAMVGLIITLLIYGIGVKYQAQFSAPIMLGWLGFLWAREGSALSGWIKTLLVGLCIYGSVFAINRTLVPDAKKSHAWEYVKFYDLAAISIGADEDLIPEANKRDNYTFEKIKERFQPSAVDPYIYAGKENILQKSKTPEEQKILWHTWAKAVAQHPFYYLKHRGVNFSYMFFGRIGLDRIEALIFKTFGIDPQNPGFFKPLIGGLGFIFLSQSWLLLLGFCYFFIGLRYMSVSPFAQVLLGYNAVAVLMVTILFFMSMAGVPRYTYISTVMIHASHIFAFGLYQDLKKRRRKLSAPTAP